MLLWGIETGKSSDVWWLNCRAGGGRGATADGGRGAAGARRAVWRDE